MGTIGKNFSYSEFERSETAKKAGIVNIINTAEIRDNVKELVRNVLQPLRDTYGKPMHINLGYRCPELNRLVGGVPSSQHLSGEAADIGCDNPFELAQLACDIGVPFDQMILYRNFVHFSHRRDGKQRYQILYSRTYSGAKIRM